MIGELGLDTLEGASLRGRFRGRGHPAYFHVGSEPVKAKGEVSEVSDDHVEERLVGPVLGGERLLGLYHVALHPSEPVLERLG